MPGDGIVREGSRGIAMIVRAIDRGEQTPNMFAPGVIKNQNRVSLRTVDRLRLVEQIREPTIVHALLEPWRLREEAGQGGFVSTLEHTASDVR